MAAALPMHELGKKNRLGLSKGIPRSVVMEVLWGAVYTHRAGFQLIIVRYVAAFIKVIR